MKQRTNKTQKEKKKKKKKEDKTLVYHTSDKLSSLARVAGRSGWGWCDGGWEGESIVRSQKEALHAG